MSIFEPPGLVKLYKVYQIYSQYAYRMMLFKISMQDGTKLLAASEIPTEMVLEGLYNSKLQDSGQLQTVLALFDQEKN